MILEAPLSGKFSKDGNPKERGEFEKAAANNGGHRYWYYGAGATTYLASIHLLREIRNSESLGSIEGTVIVYEGYISADDSGASHKDHAKALVKAFREKQKGKIEDVKKADDEILISAFDIVLGTNNEEMAPAIVFPKLKRRL